MSIESGILYIVATPLGNLGDITHRALETLGDVDLIAAEDTRHTAGLLAHFGINTPMISLHEHNEDRRCAEVIERLRAGHSIALVSDAGTPLISDPGYRVVSEVRAAGLRVSPIPGPSALIAALSVSGLPTDRFAFEGFLPAKAGARRARLEALREESRTLVFYESSHRVLEAVADMGRCLGVDRQAVIARELTKTFEQIQDGTLGGLLDWLEAHDDHRRGEFVVMLRGWASGVDAGLDEEARRVMALLLDELPLKQAARLGARILDRPKNMLYQYALSLKRPPDG